MQDNPSQRPSGREDKRLQRAVLALVLHEFPAQLTRDDLTHKGLGSADPINLAVENLANAGLLWCEEDAVLPTLAARESHASTRWSSWRQRSASLPGDLLKGIGWESGLVGGPTSGRFIESGV